MTNKEEIDKIILLLKENEPSLSEEERRDMWNNIEQENYHFEKKSRIKVLLRKTGMVAAVIVLLIACATILKRYTEIGITNYTNALPTAEVSASTLYIDGETMEMGNNAEIYCLPDQMKLRIKQGGGFVNVSYTSNKDLALSVPDNGNVKVHMQMALRYYYADALI